MTDEHPIEVDAESVRAERLAELDELMAANEVQLQSLERLRDRINRLRNRT